MRILIADDDPADIECTRRLLEGEGHEVVAARDGREALAAFRAGPEIQLVLADISMPVMDGIDLVKSILATAPDTLCAMISGTNDITRAVASLRAGAFDFIRKPSMERDLHETLERVTAMLAERDPIAADFALSENLSLLVESRRAVIAPATQRLINYCAPVLQGRRRLVDELRLALIEALMNGIVHGNLGISSAAKNDGRWNDYEIEIEQREALSEYASRKLKVELGIETESIRIAVTDEGDGFNPSQLPDASDERAMMASGRGILLMRNAMDEVRWNERGNRVEMNRRIAPRRAEPDVASA